MPVFCSIHTSRFYASHLRSPRGRGSWLFENRAGEVVFMHNGTYTEAKKAAVAFGRQNGHSLLWVCP